MGGYQEKVEKAYFGKDDEGEMEVDMIEALLDTGCKTTVCGEL